MIIKLQHRELSQIMTPRNSQISTSPKYSAGQHVKLADETIVVISPKCESELGCRYEVYFLSDFEKAAKEGREVKSAWVKESELGSVVPAFEVGQRIDFLAEPKSTGYITRSFCNPERCRYVINYVDINGVHRQSFAEEFEISPCIRVDSENKCI